MLGIQKPQIKVLDLTETEGVFVIEPLERGLGHTLGNIMRRVLLSSIPGTAITTVKIAGVQHEYSTIEGVREDTIEILLNLKELVLSLDGDEPASLRVKATKAGEVTAGDIDAPSNVTVLNPEHHIATLTKKGRLEMEMMVDKGRGYASAEENEREGDPIGVIPVDSIFSPVVNVTFKVEYTRVGQRTDFDKLTLLVRTDGSVKPDEAVSMGASILIEHIGLLADLAQEARLGEIFEPTETAASSGLDTSISELELSVRALNCLQRAKIETVQDLVSHTEEELLNIRNMGAKTVELIKEKLEARGLSLKSAE
ncbi:MAG: DNA-directed RNA polymerase subunit alpha [Actinobacteria bacterium]|nr:DNA-directed RNA polymerase subunit alpha [Actinomycetota bacterium]MBU1943020.1 DNA-directed RNA polymerase subunit alpha [Actinomycetota bacterium]MBU2686902.1 DNA-directed RNA polymerase subunit alpha [Actinomycetota bacterium]